MFDKVSYLSKMRLDINTILSFVILGLTFCAIYLALKTCVPEGFQDPSRAAVGWAAGPRNVYGFDPVDKFYWQMLQEKERRRRLGIPILE